MRAARVLLRHASMIRALLLCVLAGCALEADAPRDGCRVLQLDSAVRRAGLNRADVLLVLDPSLRAEATVLVDGLIARFDEIADRLTARFDLRITVIGSGLGVGSRAVPGCNGPTEEGLLVRGPFQWVVDRDPPDAPEPDSSALRAFLERAVGDAVARECEFSMPLLAIREAIERDGGVALGRPGTRLAVVVLTARDDCSPVSDELFDLGTETAVERCLARPDLLVQPAEWLEELRATADFPDQIGLTVVGGATRSSRSFTYEQIDQDPALVPSTVPICTDPPAAGALPARRLVDAVLAFGAASAHGALESVCEGEFGYALDRVAENVSGFSGGVCLWYEFPRGEDGRVPCIVAEQLGESDPPCAERRGGTDVELAEFSGRRLCALPQISAAEARPDSFGWFYSDDPGLDCESRPRIVLSTPLALEVRGAAFVSCVDSTPECE
jgi:hypothetical protein